MESAKTLSPNSHRLLLRNHTISATNHKNINEDRIVFAIMIAVITSLGVIVFVIYKCFRQTSSYENQTEPTPSIDTELDQIPVLIYGESTVPLSETCCSEAENCAICLEEYTNGELLRVLPKCKHMFHKKCIEEWLSVPSLHCPICRDQILEHRLQSARSNNCRNQMNNVSNQFPLFAVYGGVRNSFV